MVWADEPSAILIRKKVFSPQIPPSEDSEDTYSIPFNRRPLSVSFEMKNGFVEAVFKYKVGSYIFQFIYLT